MKLYLLAASVLIGTLCSCDDQTTGIGQFVADNDLIGANSAVYNVQTKSVLLDSVYSRSSTAYLGKFTDKTYGTFSSDFMVQINCPENFQMPDRIQSITAANLYLYYNSYYGDSLATLRVQVNPLTTAIKDDGSDKSLYYSNLNPEKYYNKNAGPLAVKDYAAYDMSVSDSIRSNGYVPNVKIGLGEQFCKDFFEKYQYTEQKDGKTIHPYFKDSEAFIQNVLKGFYIHTISGEGSILYISNIYLYLTVAHLTRNYNNTQDTLVHSLIPMSATKEVFMSTRFNNGNLIQQCHDKTRTYLKSPAGLCTEVTLPIEQMYEAHSRDTLNSISISFQKIKEANVSPYPMGTPSTLLMVRKDKMKSFFENNQTADNKTTFLGSYSSTSNSYDFSKLNRLISNIFSEIKPEIDKGEEHWTQWKEEHPSWNKVLLVPVTTDTDSKGNVIGVENDLNVNSAELIGGENLNNSTDDSNKIKMNVIFTQPVQH